MNQSQKRLWTKDFIFITLINLSVFFGFNITSVAIPLYASSLGANDFITGLTTTCITVSALLIRPFSGLILDRFGHKGILIVSLAVMAVVIAAYAIFPILAIILAIRVIHGLTWGLSSTATSTVAADVIPRTRFAEGMGYFALASSLAIAIGPALAIILMQEYGVGAMAAVATTSTIIALILAMTMKGHSTSKPTDKAKLSLFSLFEKQALLPAVLVFFIACAFASITTFIALHGHEKGVDQIWMYFTVYAVVNIVSRPFIGKLIDRIGPFWPGICAAACISITLVLVALSQNVLMFSISGVFAGLGIGTAMGTFQTMAVSTVDPARRGVATSTYLFGLDVGIGAGAMIAGGIASFAGYSTMYLVVAAFPLFPLIILLITGKKKITAYTAQKGIGENE